MPFSGVVGHEQAIELLRRAAASRRVAPAYLLVGPPNIGKTTLAKEFAKALNCQGTAPGTPPEELDSCGGCHNCEHIEHENHLDFIVLRPGVRVETRDELPAQEQTEDADAAAEPVGVQNGLALFDDQSAARSAPRTAPPPRQRSGKVTIFVELPDALIYSEQIEELLARTSAVLSRDTRHRVLVITEVDRVHLEAEDRLLKTLEEPPANTTFVLTTSRPARVKDTILSRCQIIKLQPLGPAQMLAHLRQRYPTAEESRLRAVTAMAGGRFGWALHLLESEEARAVRTELLELAAQTADAVLAECMVMGERLVALTENWLAAQEHARHVARGSASQDYVEQLRAKAVAELLKRSPDRFRRIAVNQLLDILQSWYRDLALLRAAPDSELVINSDWRDRLVQLAPLYSPAGLRFARRTIENARRDLLRHNANMRLACEVLVCKLIASRRRR